MGSGRREICTHSSQKDYPYPPSHRTICHSGRGHIYTLPEWDTKEYGIDPCLSLQGGNLYPMLSCIPRALLNQSLLHPYTHTIGSRMRIGTTHAHVGLHTHRGGSIFIMISSWTWIYPRLVHTQYYNGPTQGRSWHPVDPARPRGVGRRAIGQIGRRKGAGVTPLITQKVISVVIYYYAMDNIIGKGGFPSKLRVELWKVDKFVDVLL